MQLTQAYLLVLLTYESNLFLFCQLAKHLPGVGWSPADVTAVLIPVFLVWTCGFVRICLVASVNAGWGPYVLVCVFVFLFSSR